MFSVEMPRKLHGWQVRNMLVHVHCVGAGLKDVWQREFACASGMLYNQEDFDPTAEGRKKKGVHWRFIPLPLCVQLSRLWPSRTLLISIFCVIKRKKKQIIFLYIGVVDFLCYAIRDFILYQNNFFRSASICVKHTGTSVLKVDRTKYGKNYRFFHCSALVPITF